MSIKTRGLKPGDAVYFKRCKDSARSTAGEVLFKGHGIGILLGYLPPAARDCTPASLMRLMGQVGFMTFDDIAEFLTPADAETCVKKYEDKYYGKETPAPDREGISPILDQAGNPTIPEPTQTEGKDDSSNVTSINNAQGVKDEQTQH